MCKFYTLKGYLFWFRVYICRVETKKEIKKTTNQFPRSTKNLDTGTYRF